MTHILKHKSMVGVFQVAFCDRTLSDKRLWQMVVLILKGGGRDFRGIGIVEVLWKNTTFIITRRLMSAIEFHDTFYGFREGRGTGIAYLNPKLLQQLTDMSEVVLHKIFLDFHNFYNSLHRGRCLNILMGYGVVPMALRLLLT